MHAHSIDGILKGCRIGGLVFTAAAATISALFGWSIGSNWLESTVYAVVLASASGVVGYALVVAYHAAKAEMYGVMVAAGACFALACLVELVGHFGYSFAVRQFDVQRATEQTNVYSDTRGELDRARSELANLKKVRPVLAIESELAGMRSRIGWEKSQNCKDPGSYPTFCRQYAALGTELGIATQAKTLDQRIQSLTTKSGEITGGHSIAEAQITGIASLANRTEKPNAQQVYWTNQGVTVLLTMFLVVTGGLLNFMGNAFHGPSQPTPARRAPLNDNIERPNFSHWQPPQGLNSNGLQSYGGGSGSSRLDFTGTTGPARSAA